MIDLEEIKNQLLSGKVVEDIFKNFDWKNFEESVSNVFIENDFFVRKNFRFKTKRRYEIDIVAVKSPLVICVDCKGWASGRYKTSALRKATSKQEERVNEFRKFVKRNPIAKEILKIKNTFSFSSLLVTLVEESLITENKTHVVPFEKLNTFLLEIERYT